MGVQTFGLETYIAIFSLTLAVASSVIAIFVLVYSIRSDQRKAGIDIRYQYAISSSISSKEDWLSELTLENTKDRSAVIYKIYFEIGYGLYIEIEDFSDNPLVLDAYGVFQRQYDPVEFYSCGLVRVTGVLGNRGVRHRIVLFTSQGRHYPKPNIRVSNDPILGTL